MTTEETDAIPEDLFKDVTFYIVGEITEHIIGLLTKYGGIRDTYLSEMVSHVIADDVDNHEYQEARELFELPCVMSEWVLFSVKCKKKLDKALFAPEGRLFSGVVACASKLQEVDWLSLWSMIVVNGGRCHGNLTNKCTHLITADMEGPKYLEASKHEDSIKVVTPDWIPECVTTGLKVDEELYHPRLIVYPKPPSPPKPDTPPAPEPMEVEPAISDSQKPGMPAQPSPDEMVRPGTPGSASTKEALAKLVSNRMHDFPGQRPPYGMPPHMAGQGPYPGGMPGQHPGHHPGFRPGMHPGAGPPTGPPGYLQAHPGHYPPQHGLGPRTQGPHGTPHGQLPGMPHPQHMQHPGGPQQQHLGPGQHPQQYPGLQNQQQQNRQNQQQQQKLRNITNSIEMHKQNQQQVAHQQQPPPQTQPHGKQAQHKSGAASPYPGASPRQPPPHYFQPPNLPGFPGQQQQQPWPQYWGHDPTDNVPQDMCLLGCIFYINDYPKILGIEQIAVWKKVVEQHGGQVDPSYSNRVTHVLCANQKSDVYHLALRDQRRLVTAFWLNDVLLKKKLSAPWQALHLPLLYSEDTSKPCSNQIICITNFDGENRTRVKQMINALGAKYTGYMTRTNSALVCQRPDGIKYQKAKEWQIPVVNVRWLSDLLLGHLDALRLPIQDIYLQVGQGDEFQMDMTKVTQLMSSWRTPLKVSKEIWKRFAPNMKKNAAMNAGQENVPVVPAKKLKLEGGLPTVDLSAPGPRVLFTGFPKGLTKQLQNAVVQLGGNVVDNPQMCTHLVAQSFSRTMKFFVAINVCHHIVNKAWVEDSQKQNTFINESMYALQDTAGEQEMKCSLIQSLHKARTQPLFAGVTFYITPSVQPPTGELKKVIESAGGTLSKKRRLAARTIATLLDDQGNPTYIVITCADDIHLCEDIIAKNIKVYTAEFILTGVMRQEKNFHQFQIDIQR